MNTSSSHITAYLVGLETQDSVLQESRDLLAELVALSDTLGLEVVGMEIARQRIPNPKFILGTGKVQEIISRAKEAGANTIVFDDPLTPSQQRNWEKASDLAVIDRQEVILEIFSEHAHTKEATLQIQLAKATYALPRLQRKWTHLNRERGMAGGLGLRGGGEQQLELDSRVIRARIAWLKQQLAEVRRHRGTQRRKRTDVPLPVTALVGYTNAGKSSLLNALTSANVLVADKLFATLDPTVRKFTLPGGQKMLLADTVGFIRKLPHLLVEAFHSTLEETALAQFVLEVLDATSPAILHEHNTTLDVLKEIHATPQKHIILLNKADLLSPEQKKVVTTQFPEAILCSAVTGEGLTQVAEALEAACNEQSIDIWLLIPHKQAPVFAELRKSAAVLSEQWTENGIRAHLLLPQKNWKTAAPFLSTPADL